MKKRYVSLLLSGILAVEMSLTGFAAGKELGLGEAAATVVEAEREAETQAEKETETEPEEEAEKESEEETGTEPEEGEQIKTEESVKGTIEWKVLEAFNKLTLGEEGPIEVVQPDDTLVAASSLQDAFDMVESGGTVKLIEDITDLSTAEIATLPEDKEIIFDLNGCSITVDSDFEGRPVVNEGTMTVTGDGVIDSSNGGAAAYGAISNFGDLTIENGTFKGNIGSGACVLRSYGEGSRLTIYDADVDGAGAVLNMEGSEAYIYGGRYVGEGCNYFYPNFSYSMRNDNGTMYLYDAEVVGHQGALAAAGGYLEVHGGVYSAESCQHGDRSFYGLYVAGESGKVSCKVYGGTFKAQTYQAVLISNDGDGGLNKEATVEIYDGDFINESEKIEYIIKVDSTGGLKLAGGSYNRDIIRNTEGNTGFEEYMDPAYECVTNSSGSYVIVEKDRTELPSHGSTDSSVAVDENQIAEDTISGQEMTEAQTEDARKQIADTLKQVTDSVNQNAAVNGFTDTGLDVSVDVEKVKEETGITDLGLASIYLKSQLNNVEMETSVHDDGSVGVSLRKLTYQVAPYIKEAGMAERLMSNACLAENARIMVRLALPAFAETGKTVMVVHVSGDGTSEEYRTKIQESGDDRYCEVTVTHFSTFHVIFGDFDSVTGSSSSSGSSGGISVTSHGVWRQDDTGWWFERYDGTWPEDMWERCYWNGEMNWYHFDQSGYLDSGWFTDRDGNVYYLHDVHDNRFGYMYKGWHQINGQYYYFTEYLMLDGPKEGAMLRNTVTPDGYYVDENGVWK